MIGIKVAGPLEPVAEVLEAYDEVDYVVITAGTFDLLVEVVCEDDEHLLDIISRRIRTIDGVIATETFMYLGLRKQTYTWGALRLSGPLREPWRGTAWSSHAEGL